MAIAFFTLAETAKNRQARQRVGEPPADLLEQALLARRPCARVRALAEAEHVRLITFRVDGHHHPGLDAEALGEVGRQRMVGLRSELDRAAGGTDGAKHGGRMAVHRHVFTHGIEAGELRTRPLHLHAVRFGLGVARVHQPRAIAVEDRQRRLEHVAHHLLEIVRSLDCEVHAIEALAAPPSELALFLRPLALGDIDHDATQAGRAVALDHQGHQVAKPHDAPVGREHPIFEIVATFLNRGLLTQPHRQLAVVRMNVVPPERRFAQPTFRRVAEDALGLLAHERERERLGVRFPHDAADRIHQVAEPLLGGKRLGRGPAQLHRPLGHPSLELVARPGQRFLGATVRLDEARGLKRGRGVIPCHREQQLIGLIGKVRAVTRPHHKSTFAIHADRNDDSAERWIDTDPIGHDFGARERPCGCDAALQPLRKRAPRVAP